MAEIFPAAGCVPPSSSVLAGLLRAAIARGGPLRFREFMAAALYHPEHGYYSSGRARIGREGDFFTNVSVGALFGRLLARQFAEIWERLGRPGEFVLVEQGAHHGHFAGDVLAALRETARACFAAVEYRIVEPAGALAAVQRERLAEFLGKVRWVETLDALEPFVGVHFSNELLDALPVHRVRRTGAGWRELYVTAADECFVFVEGALSEPRLGAQLARLPEVPEGYQTEVNLGALDWIGTLAPKLIRGGVLAIDYGYSRDEYYRPERTEGTLSAYAGHQRVGDPLLHPGAVDLTAHVEFTSLVEVAERTGLSLHGFTEQHHFMVGLSQGFFDDTAPLTAARQQDIRAFQTLMHPALLGRSFKVLCLTKDLTDPPPLTGFQFASDPRAALGLG